MNDKGRSDICNLCGSSEKTVRFDVVAGKMCWNDQWHCKTGEDKELHRLRVELAAARKCLDIYRERFGDISDPTRNNLDPDWPYELIEKIRAKDVER